MIEKRLLNRALILVSHAKTSCVTDIRLHVHEREFHSATEHIIQGMIYKEK
jgi:hypothetical protein